MVSFERPRVHFTPPQGWLSDPNGLVHADGTYHLYYQHHPHDITWGPMHWGHATSPDLVAWQHRPVALVPDERGTIYSGSAVIGDDTADLGPQPVVAAFTHHRDDAEEISLAWSRDGGDTFTRHPGPVIDTPVGQRDFRDPRILRYAGDAGHWVMLVAAGHSVWIYTSPDLSTWTRSGVVSGVFGDAATWEMPELVRFEVDQREVWLLVVSVLDGAPAGGSGVRAVAGHFDGSTFTPAGDAFWVDHGPAFYAPQAWSNAPDGRRIWVAWMGNWHTVQALPAEGWRGQMSIPRELALRAWGPDYRLVQVPVPELDGYRDASLVVSGAEVARYLDAQLPLVAPALDLTIGTSAPTTVTLHCERAGQAVTVHGDPAAREVVVMLGHRGVDETTYRGPLAPDEAGVRILLDAASVEVFAGITTISADLPNCPDPWSVRVDASPSTNLVHLEGHTLADGSLGVARPGAP